MSYEDYVKTRLEKKPEPFCPFSICYCNDAYSNKCYGCEESRKDYEVQSERDEIDEDRDDDLIEHYDHYLRYGVILTDHKTKRFIIAMQDGHQIVFLREFVEDPFARCDYYKLYENALTDEQAEEILDQMKAGDTRKARVLLKRYFRSDKPSCEDVGPVVLDDRVPDEWYTSWKEMEGIITSDKHIIGYFGETKLTEYVC